MIEICFSLSRLHSKVQNLALKHSTNSCRDVSLLHEATLTTYFYSNMDRMNKQKPFPPCFFPRILTQQLSSDSVCLYDLHSRKVSSDQAQIPKNRFHVRVLFLCDKERKNRNSFRITGLKNRKSLSLFFRMCFSWKTVYMVVAPLQIILRS